MRRSAASFINIHDIVNKEIRNKHKLYLLPAVVSVIEKMLMCIFKKGRRMKE